MSLSPAQKGVRTRLRNLKHEIVTLRALLAQERRTMLALEKRAVAAESKLAGRSGAQARVFVTMECGDGSKREFPSVAMAMEQAESMAAENRALGYTVRLVRL